MLPATHLICGGGNDAGGVHVDAANVAYVNNNARLQVNVGGEIPVELAEVGQEMQQGDRLVVNGRNGQPIIFRRNEE